MKKLMLSVLGVLVCGQMTMAQTELPADLYAVNTNVQKQDNEVLQADEDPGRSKSFSRTFPIGQSDKISLSNQFGAITIKNWDRKEVKADIQITAYSNSEQDAQKLLDEVNIEASKSGDQIAFETKLERGNGNWGSGTRNGKKWRRELRVNYVVYMPSANPLTVNLQYGNVTMGDYAGPVTAKVQYGNFKALNLKNASNNIMVQYGRTDIEVLNRANIKHQYGSGLSLGTVGSINLVAQYVKSDIRSVSGSAVIKQQYGEGLSLGSVADLTLNAQYAGVSIGTLNGDAKMDVQYNNLSIAKVNASCKRLDIDAQYVKLALDFAAGYNSQLDVQTNYGSFDYGNAVSVKLQGGDDDRGRSFSKVYTGKIGNGSGNIVRIKSSYCTVSIK